MRRGLAEKGFGTIDQGLRWVQRHTECLLTPCRATLCSASSSAVPSARAPTAVSKGDGRGRNHKDTMDTKGSEADPRETGMPRHPVDPPNASRIIACAREER